jgi:hypothetical protein
MNSNMRSNMDIIMNMIIDPDRDSNMDMDIKYRTACAIALFSIEMVVSIVSGRLA